MSFKARSRARSCTNCLGVFGPALAFACGLFATLPVEAAINAYGLGRELRLDQQQRHFPRLFFARHPE